MPYYTPFITLLLFSLSTNLVFGLAPSNQSYPGSILQECLDTAFTDASLRTFPQDVDYLSKINLYNLDYPVYPAALVRPTKVEEVSAAVKCAVKADVKIQPRSGGHSYANYCLGGVDGALVVDLVHLQKFETVTTWEATIASAEGALLGDVTTRLHDVRGRAIAHGACPQVGIGGHATIGGLVGPTSRQWGSTLNHIHDVEVVLSNGTANENQNPDLYFAIRGAGASIGSIVTEFVFITHPEPGTTVRYSYTFKSGNAQALAETFAKWQSFISNTPDLDRKLALILIVTPAGIVISGAIFFVAVLFSYQNPRTRNDGHLRGAV